MIALLRGAIAGHGTVVLLEGDPGIGKSLLISELKRRVADAPELEGAIFAIGHCSQETGPQDAYQPFVEILADLASLPGRRGHTALMPALKESVPDLAKAVPGIGSLLGVGTKLATVWFQGDDQKARSATTLRQYEDRIEHVAREHTLLVLVIEDGQWIDHASSVLLLALCERMDKTRLVIVLSARTGELSPDHPLRRVESELVPMGRLEVVRLQGLDRVEISAYLEQRFGTVFSADFPDWLIHVCEGHPLFISQYLNLLEQEQIISRTDEGFHLDGGVERQDRDWQVSGRLAAEVPSSADIDALLDRRIQRLLDDERAMLEIGAVQGLYFDSVVLAQVAERRELAILAELRHVSERDRIIHLFDGEGWMRDKSETYAFEHLLMQQAFYRRLSRRELELYHKEIGGVLQQLVAEFESPPRKLLIDVAFHASHGGELAVAAEYYLRAAQQSYEEGATVEAVALCRDALDCLHALPMTAAGRDGLLAETVVVRLVSSQFGAGDAASSREVLELADEGEAAAKRAGRKAILAEILALKGHFYIRVGNVPEAIAVFRSAVALAKEIDDPIAEFVAETQLGSQLAKEDLAESMEVRYAAHDLFVKRIANADLPVGQQALLLRQYSSLLVLIGLGEFDRGDFEKAIEWLERGVQEMRARSMFDELMAALNYLAQVLACLGLYETAVSRLEESLSIYDAHHRQRSHPWVGYNLGLLAHIQLEMGDLKAAVKTMEEAVRISEAAEHIDLLTLVWNYQAELLLGVGLPTPDLDRAARVLENNLDVSGRAGLHRSAAQAASLMGQVLARRGAFQGAYTYSARAIAEIDARGDMPAVRTEEILYYHWIVLEGLGHRAEAARILERAWQVVQRKLGLIHLPDHRTAFLNNVPLNQRIALALKGN